VPGWWSSLAKKLKAPPTTSYDNAELGLSFVCPKLWLQKVTVVRSADEEHARISASFTYFNAHNLVGALTVHVHDQRIVLRRTEGFELLGTSLPADLLELRFPKRPSVTSVQEYAAAMKWAEPFSLGSWRFSTLSGFSLIKVEVARAAEHEVARTIYTFQLALEAASGRPGTVAEEVTCFLGPKAYQFVFEISPNRYKEYSFLFRDVIDSLKFKPREPTDVLADQARPHPTGTDEVWVQAIQAADSGRADESARLFASVIRASPWKYCGVGRGSVKPKDGHAQELWLKGMIDAGFTDVASALSNPARPGELTITGLMEADRAVEAILARNCERLGIPKPTV
jgi:hypothetical protein